MVSNNCIKLAFFPPGNYILGEQGAMNCPDGFIIVKDEDECRTSASKFDKPFKGVGCWHTEISGCLDNGPGIYFSNCAQWSTRHNHAAVCKEIG